MSRIVNPRSRSLRWRWLFVMLALLVAQTALARVSQSEIDTIRSYNVLMDKHMQTIDTFVAEQFQAMLAAEKDSEIAEAKESLLESTESKLKYGETRQMYSNRFSQAVKDGYRSILERLGKLEDQELVQQIRRAAIVVVAGTDNAVLIEELLVLLNDESPIARYWAAKGLTMPNIVRHLTGSEVTDNSAVDGVLAGLEECLEKEMSGEIIAQIAAAAALTNRAQGYKLLQDCAKKRVGQYVNWTVDNELADLAILQLLFGTIESPTKDIDAKEMVRSAAELFSAAYYRYSIAMQYKGTDDEVIELIGPDSRQDLQTVLSEGEVIFLRLGQSDRGRRFGGAMQRDKWSELDTAYNTMLGPRGVLDRKFDIYPAGNGEEQPPLVKLDEPPALVVERAQARMEIANKSIGADLY